MPQEYARDIPAEQPKQGRFRRILGGIGRAITNPRVLGAVQTGAGALSAQYGGSRIPLQIALEREGNEREDLLHQEEIERQRPMEELRMENERLRQQLLGKQIGAFRTPEQESAAALEQKRKEAALAQELAPPKLQDFGGRVYELPRKAGEPLQDPLQPTAPLDTLPGMHGPIVPSKPIPLPSMRRPLEVQGRVTRQRVVQDPASQSGWSTEFYDQHGRLVDSRPNATPPVGFAPSERASTTTDEFGNKITTSSTTRRTLGGPQTPSPTRPTGATPPSRGGAPKPPLASPSAPPLVSSLADIVEKTGEWSLVPPKGRSAVEAELQRRGAVILTPDQRKAIESVATANSIVDSMDAASKQVHTTSDLPFARFGRAGSEMAEQAIFGNPALAELEAHAAALAPLIRTLGEKGNLANEDIERAQTAAVMDRAITRAEAEARLKTLRGFFAAAEVGIKATAGKTGSEILAGRGRAALGAKDLGPAPAGKAEGSTGTLPDGTKVVIRNGRIIAQ